jgi:hypothetical protein
MKFILCADLHLRVDRPRCRKDNDWLLTESEQLQFISNQARDNVCPILIAGDIFHTAQVPDILKTMFQRAFYGRKIYAIAGQHDLPHHSWGKVMSSSFGVLMGSDTIESPVFFGCDCANYNGAITSVDTMDSDILVIHDLVFESEKQIPPNVKAKTAKELLVSNKSYKWILCGDIHSGYHFEEKGRHVIMAGCMNRQAADMKDYTPRIWLIDTDTDEVVYIPIPDDVEMVDDEYLVKAEDRADRIASFIETIKGTKKISLDYIENVKSALTSNNFSIKEEQIILELLEG